MNNAFQEPGSSPEAVLLQKSRSACVFGWRSGVCLEGLGSSFRVLEVRAVEGLGFRVVVENLEASNECQVVRV